MEAKNNTKVKPEAGYKTGDTVDAKITIRIPANATREQVAKWAEYQLGFTGGLSGDNPLIDYDLETDAVFLEG